MRSWRRRLRTWAVALVVLYGVWCVALRWLETRLLFPTYMIGSRSALRLDERGPVRRIDVRGPEGVVETLVVQPKAGARTGPGPVAILFHGNAELSHDHIDSELTAHLRSRGFVVVLPEFRGYGTMPGTPSQKGIGADMAAVADWVAEQPWCDKRRVVYFGWSLGSGVACDLAAQRPPGGGMILQSAFTSVASFARSFLVPQWLVRNAYRSDRVLETFDGPVLLIHGVRDSVVPVAHGRALAKIARRGTYVELEGDHFHDWADWAAYFSAIDNWLSTEGI